MATQPSGILGVNPEFSGPPNREKRELNDQHRMVLKDGTVIAGDTINEVIEQLKALREQ